MTVDEIIACILSRASNPDTIHDMVEGLSPTPQIAPPASPGQLAAVEACLGFSLPLLLKRLYIDIGDGGFGPGYGLMSLEELCQSYDELRQLLEWPEKVVPLCTWGCGIYSCVDCSDAAEAIFFYYPDTHVLDGYGISEVTLTDVEGETILTYEPEQPVSEDSDTQGEVSLLFHKSSLQAWLDAWGNGQDLWKEMTEALGH